MPLHESKAVKVIVTIEVDGHTLTFEESGQATGARYHGSTETHGYGLESVLEHNVRGTVDTNLARAQRRALEAVSRLYPVAEELMTQASA